MAGNCILTPFLKFQPWPVPSFPLAHAVKRVRVCACVEGSGDQTSRELAQQTINAVVVVRVDTELLIDIIRDYCSIQVYQHHTYGRLTTVVINSW